MYSRMSVCPVNELPDELLANIFIAVRDILMEEDLEDLGINEMQWTDLLRVCRRWHAVGEGTRLLWTHLYADNAPGLTVKHFLECSRPYSGLILEIKLCDASKTVDVLESALRPEDAMRITSLTVEWERTAWLEVRAFIEARFGELGRIQSLKLCVYDESAGEGDIQLPHMPTLQSLIMEGVRVHVSPVGQPSLRILDIADAAEYCSDDDLMTSKWLLPVLQRCPNLQTLDIADFDSIGGVLGPNDPGAIVLPHLQRIQLKDYPFRIQELLSHIRYDPARAVLQITSVHARTVLDEGVFADLVSDTFSPVGSLSPTYYSQRATVISLHTWIRPNNNTTFQIAAGYDPDVYHPTTLFDFHIWDSPIGSRLLWNFTTCQEVYPEIGGDDDVQNDEDDFRIAVIDAFEGVSSLFVGSRITTLMLHTGPLPASLEADDWIPLLDSFPNLANLAIGGVPAAVQYIQAVPCTAARWTTLRRLHVCSEESEWRGELLDTFAWCAEQPGIWGGRADSTRLVPADVEFMIRLRWGPRGKANPVTQSTFEAPRGTFEVHFMMESCYSCHL